MTKQDNNIPLRKSERIAQVIALANQVAAIDWLHAILEEQAEPLRRELEGLRASTSQTPVVNQLTAIESPARQPKSAKTMSSYWARMTPEERSAEMKRRKAKGGKPKELSLSERLKLHPRDKRSPKHADWLKMMGKANKKRFANMSATERENWKAAMIAGRRKQGAGQRVNGVATV